MAHAAILMLFSLGAILVWAVAMIRTWLDK
jgi:hypothetical protein